MNLPNKLTVSRIILAFVFMLFLFVHALAAKIAALVIFIVACLTDLYDGRIARKHSDVTEFGKLMDPIADKILVLAAFVAFVELKIIPAWMTVLIFSRELIVTSIRLRAAAKGKVIPAVGEGKNKTASQMFAIFAILVYIIIRNVAQNLGAWKPMHQDIANLTIWTIVFITVLLTLTSGIAFLIKNSIGLDNYAKTDN